MKKSEKARRLKQNNRSFPVLLTVLCLLVSLTSCTIPDSTEPSTSPATTVTEITTVPTTQPEAESTAIPTESTEKATEPPATTEETIPETTSPFAPPSTDSNATFSLSDIPAFSGQPFVAINHNMPYFTAEDLTTTSYETYSPLDALGRCGVCYANVGLDLMPTEERGEIGMVKPTGWHTVKYDCVDGKYLYNRCHLIGFQLSGENANTKNLITGTRYLNINGMLPFENMVADYVKDSENHVLYRVTPIFRGDNLLADGVLMEGWSVEDSGDGICFCVFAYNAQPGVVIDYVTGDSYVEEVPTEPTQTDPPETRAPETQPTETEAGVDYVLNINSKKFHYPDCPSVKRMKESNKEYYTGSRDDLIAMGYDPCKNCNP